MTKPTKDISSDNLTTDEFLDVIGRPDFSHIDENYAVPIFGKLQDDAGRYWVFIDCRAFSWDFAYCLGRSARLEVGDNNVKISIRAEPWSTAYKDRRVFPGDVEVLLKADWQSKNKTKIPESWSLPSDHHLAGVLAIPLPFNPELIELVDYRTTQPKGAFY